jgi:putative component of membrane protein insertase Oxa1/YidC/SpoIIIJ protein YidD
MRDAVVVHGVIRGSMLGLRRLARCHPLGGHGIDPVPPGGHGAVSSRHS